MYVTFFVRLGLRHDKNFYPIKANLNIVVKFLLHVVSKFNKNSKE